MAATALTARSFFRDKGVRWVLGGWAIFTAENVVLSEYKEDIKRSWGGKGGPKAYQRVYSLCSTAAMGTTVLAYCKFARTGLQLSGYKSVPVCVAAFGFRAAGLIMIGQLFPPFDLGELLGKVGLSQETQKMDGPLCPWDLNSNKEKGEVYGIIRVTRRPELVGLASLGIGGALLAGTAAQAAFFGVGPLVCFSILAWHGDRAQRKTGELSPTKEAEASVLPFLAILDGRQPLKELCEEVEPYNLQLALSVALLFALRPPWMRWVK